MFKKSPYPAIYYIYGNARYQEELEELCKSFFPMTSKLNMSNPNGCGFRVECFDQNDLSRFDVEIEKYEAWIQNYRKTDFSDLNNDLRSEMTLKLQEMGVDVKYHHHEVGAAGQLELEVELDNMKKMADETMMAKYVIKNEAVTHGKTATFMPKPLYGEAGSGMHVHMLLRKDGKNLFYDEKGYSKLSKEAHYFIGGILKHSRSLLAFTNPSTNSYKRLVPGFEAPVSICFATGNRSSVIRIPGYVKDPAKRRFEFRPSDATCNPYIAYSALLMAGLDGIINKIDPTKEGFGPYDVNVFDLPEEERNKIGSLPKSLTEALEELKKDHDFLLRDGVFDEHFINNWIKYKYESEIVKVLPVPAPIEYQLYYDI